jgi:hypothetical protein
MTKNHSNYQKPFKLPKTVQNTKNHQNRHNHKKPSNYQKPLKCPKTVEISKNRWNYQKLFKFPKIIQITKKRWNYQKLFKSPKSVQITKNCSNYQKPLKLPKTIQITNKPFKLRKTVEITKKNIQITKNRWNFWNKNVCNSFLLAQGSLKPLKLIKIHLEWLSLCRFLTNCFHIFLKQNWTLKQFPLNHKTLASLLNYRWV